MNTNNAYITSYENLYDYDGFIGFFDDNIILEDESDYDDDGFLMPDFSNRFFNANVILEDDQHSESDDEQHSESDDEQHSESDDEPDHEPGDEPDHEPGDEPDDEPGDEPDDEPGDEPDYEPDNEFDDEPDNEPVVYDQMILLLFGSKDSHCYRYWFTDDFTY